MTNSLNSALQPFPQHSFLLRVWQIEDGHWRIMLLNTHTRERYGFRDIGEAFIFIETFCREGEHHE